MRAMDIDYLLTATRSARKSLDLSAPVDRDNLRECPADRLQGRQRLEQPVVALGGGGGRGEAGGARPHLPGDLRRDHRAHPRRRPRVPHGQALRPDHVVDRVARRAHRRGAGACDPVLRALHALTRGRRVVPARHHLRVDLPAGGNFQLALHTKGMGTCITTMHLLREAEVRELLGIPESYVQGCLLPVGRLRAARRSPLDRASRSTTS